VLGVLEDVLPRRFGGEPGDYQLVEDEDDGGRPCVRLLVHPRLGALDPEAVADTVLRTIGGGRGVERVVELAWRDAGLLQVERRAPLATETGKVRHFHVGRVGRAARAARPAI
jgi:hypothetical protein